MRRAVKPYDDIARKTGSLDYRLQARVWHSTAVYARDQGAYRLDLYVNGRAITSDVIHDDCDNERSDIVHRLSVY